MTNAAPSGPTFRGNTNVTVLLSSTANDELAQFSIVFQNITLTSESGKTVTLFSGTQGAEFIGINGNALPLTTALIPQGIYTAANVTLGSAQFTCETLSPVNGGIASSVFAYGHVPADHISMNLASPLTITGNAAGLQLNLLVSQSASYSTCFGANSTTFAITPTFAVTPVNFAAQPTNPENGKILGLQGEIAASNSATNFTLTEAQTGLTCPCPGLNTLNFTTSSNTVFQEAGNSSSFSAGTLLDMDAAIQPDGSLLATRIATYDPAAATAITGPIMHVDEGTSPQIFASFTRQDLTSSEIISPVVSSGSILSTTVLQPSGQFNNLSALPFVASFTSANMVAGQNISVFSNPVNSTQSNAIVLMPQTINGTVVDSSPSGNFTDYTVTLASTDLFPTLAVQFGQATLLNSPNKVEVYVDSNAQLLNTQTLGLGSTLRFYGLVFNDNGTLRMDCAQVNDGVTASSETNAVRQPTSGAVRTVRLTNAGVIQQTFMAYPAQK
ncbi:MAG TPA: DUF5666 domain-containing protein [Terriglobales bacterium]